MVGVVLSEDVGRVLAVRADAAGVSVDVFVDMLLRSQLWFLDEVGV